MDNSQFSKPLEITITESKDMLARIGIEQDRSILIKHRHNHIISRLFSSIRQFIKTDYDPKNWEDTLEECYNTIETEIDKYDEVIVEQTIMRAELISLNDHAPVEFPWHGRSEAEFNSFDQKLQRALPSIIECNNRKSIIHAKRKYKTIYQAYFKRPITVFERDESGLFPLNRDGRHRVFSAQKNGGYLPVWIVKYIDITSISLEEYRRIGAFGEWRFYEPSTVTDKTE